MIYGIGTDIAENSRFLHLVKKEGFIDRFFNKEEQAVFQNEQKLCEHYASRFAAKEAFSKALGTGIVGFGLKEITVLKDQKGKPYFCFSDALSEKIRGLAGENFKVHLSISHEKEYSVSFVVIEGE